MNIRELMAHSGLKFGTSGARGLVADMTDFVCYACTRGFLQYLQSTGDLNQAGTKVAVAGDLRPSTGRIMASVMRGARDAGCAPVDCGRVPSPAVALLGLSKRVPAIMVTGSHIPADRNGIKFNKPTGEVLKEDEAGICDQTVAIPDGLFNAAGALLGPAGSAFPVSAEARERYLARYLECFGSAGLQGARIGVYQHSAVGAELLLEMLRGLGAQVTPLGPSEQFVPVDTEAIRDEDVQLAARWAQEHRFDAIVSTDGDSDRPLISDENGRWLRGDVAGILCARFLQADSVSTPISCNTAVERCHWFREVRRTRIGSPYVIRSMIEASAQGARRVVGYEANGGFLTNSDFSINGRPLRALPTRDAVILLLSVLLLARQEEVSVSGLCAALPARFTASGLLRECPPERSRAILDRFMSGGGGANLKAVEAAFFPLCGTAASVDRTDGLRVTFENGEIVHLRPSGNAPEFRCYNEATSQARAEELNSACLDLLRQWVRSPRPA